MPNKVTNKFLSKTKPMENRGQQTKIEFPEYHTTAWRRIRLAQLEQYPLCAHCLIKNINTPASVCDHINPVKEYRTKGFDFWTASTPENLQSLCESCHNRKSAKEK